MKKSIFILLILFFTVGICLGEKGLWLIHTDSVLKNEIFEKGYLLNYNDIYNENNPSLKDAVVKFGDGCTGSIISDRGMILTNHHCGLPYIERLSSGFNEYIEKGFLAEDCEQEIPIPGLSVQIVDRIIDVTNELLDSIQPDISELKRNEIIQTKSKVLINEYTTEDKSLIGEIRPILGKNRYHLYLYQKFTDIRLVMIPPFDIGGFRKDEDNWEWPRYTGDFSIFRIYVDKNNRPATYDKNNTPYIPKKHLKISLNGIKEEDPVFLIGYPGRTSELISSNFIKATTIKNLPFRISFFSSLKSDIDVYKNQEEYAEIFRRRYSNIVNILKKNQGLQAGFKNAIAFDRKIHEDSLIYLKTRHIYPTLQKDIENVCLLYEKYGLIDEIFKETLSFVHLFSNSIYVTKMAESVNYDSDKIPENQIEFIRKGYGSFHSEYDKKVFIKSMSLYAEMTSQSFHFQELTKNKNNIKDWADEIYATTCFKDSESLLKVLLDNPVKIKEDPLVKIYNEIMAVYNDSISKKLYDLRMTVDSLHRQYSNALVEIYPEYKLYPEGNGTIRLSFGKVHGYTKDNIIYPFYTTLNNTLISQITDSDIFSQLNQLYINKDFSVYGDNRELPICFITTCQTSGGNSGSPVMNIKGELIGLNFDRNEDGVFNDIFYEEENARNICLDIRYILFIIDKLFKSERIKKELIS